MGCSCISHALVYYDLSDSMSLRNDPLPTVIYSLSLHDALPISKGKKRSGARPGRPQPLRGTKGKRKGARLWYLATAADDQRSEERFSRNAETDVVCRLLLGEKNSVVLVVDPLGGIPDAMHHLRP